MVAKRAQHVAPNNVAICCVDMLRSFGRGLKKDVKSVETIQRRVAQPDLLRGNTEEKMTL